jgi:hypothetical protein
MRSFLRRQSQPSTYVEGMVLAGLTLLGGVIRAYGLGHRSLWFDEAVVYWISREGLSTLFSANAAANSAPPLHVLLVHWFQIDRQSTPFPIFAAGTAAVLLSTSFVSVFAGGVLKRRWSLSRPSCQVLATPGMRWRSSCRPGGPCVQHIPERSTWKTLAFIWQPSVSRLRSIRPRFLVLSLNLVLSESPGSEIGGRH